MSTLVGDEQHMLPYGTGSSLHAFIIIVFCISLTFFPSVIETSDRTVNGISISLLYFPFFYESNTEGTNMFMFYVCKMCMICIVFNFCKI